jgi:hypothetical protein
VFSGQCECFPLSLWRYVIAKSFIRYYSIDGVRVGAAMRARSLNRPNVFFASQLIDCEPYVWRAVRWSRWIRVQIDLVHSSSLPRTLGLVAPNLFLVESHREGTPGQCSFIGGAQVFEFSRPESFEATVLLGSLIS